MIDSSKWTIEASADEPVHEVAVRTIKARLAAIRFYLPLAAEKPAEDVEYVHQLRVATRRTVAAMEMYLAFFPKGPRKEICRELKQLRKAAGLARDLDVLVQRHAKQATKPRAQEFLKFLQQKRCLAQQPLCAAYESTLINQSLDALEQQLYEGVRKGTRKRKRKAPLFGRWARKRLRTTVKAFFQAEPEELNDLDSIHEFRIRGKELRYAMELLSTAFPETFRTELYPLVEHLQDRLGDINDHAVALDRFTQWSDETADASQRKHLKRLTKKEKQELQEALWRFARWWTPKRSKRFQGSFRKLANGKKK